MMKTTFAAFALALVLLPVSLRAVDPRTFEGVNIEGVRQVSQTRDMPEIYQLAPNTRRYQMRKAVVQVRLGEAWIYFNADRTLYYLNKVPGENAATYFGPINGDAFEVFKLEERFIKLLRGDSASDVSDRIAPMLRTDNHKLRERALRIMTAGLASDIPGETRFYHVARFAQLAAELEGDDVAPLRAAIAETEKRITELTMTFPDSDYSPGDDELARQGKLKDGMKPGTAVPAAAWGEAVNGLRAAAVFSTTAPRLRQDISVWLLVENASTQDIRFACSDVIQSAHPRITDANGKEVQAAGSFYTGLSPIVRYKLRPGERVTLTKKSLAFGNKNDAGNAGFGGNRAAAGPGEYRVRYESVLATGSAWSRQEDGLMHRTMPAKGEWSGYLGATAETKIIVAVEGKAPTE
jgi:hypothetical protein